MIEIIGKNYKVYLNKERLVNIFYNQSKKEVYVKYFAESHSYGYIEFKYTNVKDIIDV